MKQTIGGELKMGIGYAKNAELLRFRPRAPISAYKEPLNELIQYLHELFLKAVNTKSSDKIIY